MTNTTFNKPHTDMHPQATGFPSPAMEYQESSLDLNRLLIKHSAATFFFRFIGHDGAKLGIVHGDLLVIDRACDPSPDRLLLVEHDGQWALCPGSDLHACGESLRVWGVVTWVLHRP